MDNWMNERWPLSYLDATIKWKLANYLDPVTATGLGYPRFAAELGYNTQEIELIRVRGGANAGNSNSVTYALLLDYEMRRGSVQGIQHALEEMGHIAAEVIPAFIESMLQSNPGYRVPFNSGNQNSDVFNCNCPQCHTQLPDYRHINPDRPHSVQQQTNMPNDSSLSPQSDTGRWRQTTEPTSIGCAVPGSNLSNSPNSASPIWNNGSSSAQTSNTIHVNNPSASRTPLSANPYGERSIRGHHSSTAINGDVNDIPCNCEDCRIKSDPEQTQRLTLRSNPKSPCVRHTPSYRNTQHVVQEQKQRSRSVGHDTVSSRFSQLYLDSEESQETSSENRENLNETCVKSVFSESDRVQNNVPSNGGGEPSADGNNQTGSIVQSRNSERRPLCSRSDISEHRLGDMIDTCPVCRNNSGARPNTGTGSKSSTRPRNTSASEGAEPDRNSWPYSSRIRNNGTGNMHSVMSDSILSVPRLLSSSLQHSDGDHVINETLYSKISSHSRLVHSAESSESASSMACHDDIRNVQIQQTVTRDIVPSDSSNRSGPPAGESSDRPPIGASGNRPPISTSSDRPQAEVSGSSPPGGASSVNPPGGASSASPPGGASSVSPPGGASSVSPPGGASSTNSASAQKRHYFVFVTYSWNGITDPDSFIQEILALCCALKEAGIPVKIDMNETSYASLRLNRLDWIDKNVREARYVIVCISPTYSRDIREPDPRQLASPHYSQLNARYIFDKLREEYYSNQCQNRRVIPIMFTNYGTTMQSHVPSCMSSTLVYSYPGRTDAIIAAVQGHGSYQQS